MPYLLNLVYWLVLLLASPWLIWSAIHKGKYREGFDAKLLGNVPELPVTRQRLWFHAVSVGEVNLLAPLLREIEQRHPDWQCVVSTTTTAGSTLAKKKYPHLTVFYAPLDFTWAVRRAMRRIRPTMLVLAELELWPNLIRAAKEGGAKVAIVNGRLSAQSFRGYQLIGWLAKRVLADIDSIAAQNDEYADRFRTLGAAPHTVHVTGSIKFDGAQTDRNNEATQRLRQLAGFADDDIVFLAGSTQAPEEELAIETFRALKDEYPTLRLVLVPRHPHRFDEVAELLERSGLEWTRRSKLLEGPRSQVPGPKSNSGSRPGTWDMGPGTPRLLLVDTIGELSAWWGTAAIGFVGGSLGSRGGQNMIEPAAYGVATCFGPNTQNFRDVVQMLLARDAAVVVQNGEELTAFVRRCLELPSFQAELGQRAQVLVGTQSGATAASVTLLEMLAGPVASFSGAKAA
jgi:3-deoxy-D-manno-octulosonic-acid transferase